jgi:hypothetical protein
MKANTEILDGVEVRVNETAQGKIYSKNFRSLAEEVKSAGTDYCRLVQKNHAFFLGNKSYYVGPSLKDKDFAGLKAVASDVQICESSIDGKNWVPTLFLPTTGECGSLGLL